MGGGLWMVVRYEVQFPLVIAGVEPDNAATGEHLWHALLDQPERAVELAQFGDSCPVIERRHVLQRDVVDGTPSGRENARKVEEGVNGARVLDLPHRNAVAREAGCVTASVVAERIMPCSQDERRRKTGERIGE